MGVQIALVAVLGYFTMPKGRVAISTEFGVKIQTSENETLIVEQTSPTGTAEDRISFLAYLPLVAQVLIIPTEISF